MDWINLSAKNLRSLVFQRSVTAEELSSHDTENDCWILLGDHVYDVTKYIPFHPGGNDELLRAAGCDGTALFSEMHAWVNYEALLKSCCVGKFTGDRNKLTKPKDYSSNGNNSTNKNAAGTSTDVQSLEVDK